MKKISSISNSTIKHIRGLRSKKFRNQTARFFIEGIRQVGEAVENSFPLETVIYCPELLTSEYGSNLVETISGGSIDIIEVTAEVFCSIASKDGPQGLAAVGIQNSMSINEYKFSGLWILLEEIQDPGNLGSIIRSLDGSGGKGVILLGDSTDPFHPTAVRSSTGSLFYVPIIKTTMDEFSAWKLESSYYIAGTVCDSGMNYREQNYPEDMILAMGSEQKGLSERLSRLCDVLLRIPMSGKVDSLNIANAASVVLFEIYAGRESRK